MPTLTELHDKRGTLVTEARSALDAITANTDDARTAELEKRHDDIMADLDKLDATIKREERVAQAEAALEERQRQQRPNGDNVETRGQDDGDKIEYRDVFNALRLAGFDPQALSAEQRDVLKAGVAKFEQRAQSTSAAAGGYTIPTELANKVSETLKVWGPMADEAICTVITTSSGNAIDFPTVDDTATAVAKHTEAAAMTDDGGVDAVLDKKTLNGFAYDTEWVQISMELLQDSIFDFESFIAGLLGKRLGRRANTELTVGDGNGDPNGIVTASALGKTAAAVAALTTDELIDLQHSVDPAYRASPKCRFMFHDNTLAAIRKLKGGDGQYIWTMGDIRNGEPDRLLNKPYSINQAMPQLATGNKTVVFGDFAEYYVRKIGMPVIGVRREYYWPNIGLAGVMRLDGELLQSSAVKHLIQA